MRPQHGWDCSFPRDEEQIRDVQMALKNLLSIKEEGFVLQINLSVHQQIVMQGTQKRHVFQMDSARATSSDFVKWAKQAGIPSVHVCSSAHLPDAQTEASDYEQVLAELKRFFAQHPHFTAKTGDFPDEMVAQYDWETIACVWTSDSADLREEFVFLQKTTAACKS
ncbi:hypothetical protein M3Y99_00128600 [Aphelenchoides fujianensis]|nr:hypothetical protein M3Y99_00128600 [Aphelenchoides fujianensis]